MSKQLRYTIDVTVQSDHGTPAPTYRYTGEFDSPVDEGNARGLRRYALALAGLKSRVTDDADDPVDGTETAEDALRRTAKELIDCRAHLERVQEDRDDTYKRADRAERRCFSLARALDLRDGHARDLVTALTLSGFPLPWWITATRSLDALDALANSAQLEPDTSEGLTETLDRIGEETKDVVAPIGERCTYEGYGGDRCILRTGHSGDHTI